MSDDGHRHQNLLGDHETNHWPHRWGMKLFDSNRYGAMMVMAVSISVRFGSGLRSEPEQKTFDTFQLKMIMA
jgi:hypothetical protein